MGAAEINRFLTDLAVNGHVSASTQNQAFAALQFLYRQVLQVPLERIRGVVRANRPRGCPWSWAGRKSGGFLLPWTACRC
jgi:hypothetical protein